jgi:Ca2+-binding EF-hand superfamily protein
MQQMKKTLAVAAAALTLSGLGLAVAVAQDMPGRSGGEEQMQHVHWRGGHGHGGGERGWRRGGGAGFMRQLETFDANGDDAVTQGEIDQFRQGQITRFDADGNGTLSLEEYQALWLDAMRERMVDAFQEHDDDGDGQVTVVEFNERYTDLVERFDRNGDGQLSAADRGARRGAKPAEAPAEGATPPQQ